METSEPADSPAHESDETARMIDYAQKLLDTAIEVVGAAQVTADSSWARNPKVVALTLLCRSLSNFRAALLLAQQRHVMEARALVRCLYENQLWIGALRERGGVFVEEMIQDEAYNRNALATLTLKLTSKHGGDVNSGDSLTLRDIVKDHAKRFPRQNELQAARTAAAGVVELSYVEYMRFSLDAVHCSVTALGRHLSHEKTDAGIELLVSVC
ncbi:hypothetical protein P0R31_39630 [Bradyrhizobium yuanmingense]|uniref:DUF5677 domain-containing protein n=1 Tax=Bradyrhizobium yuanmingense TaxID=108015 RepID=UPI0023B8C4B9|nr:DUF5677 domain-containing protein [Bradyrhizobium yuanmingense]MDF0523305.1 hypothetical protein [Bradyrhizobium yuanmingense]